MPVSSSSGSPAKLDRSWPDAASSLREGMTETLTLMRLAVTGNLAKTLSSTNPCESMIEVVRHTQRNVKRWQDGDMRKRWTAAGMLVAEQQFRRNVDYSNLAQLVTRIEHRHLALQTQNQRDTDVRQPVTVRPSIRRDHHRTSTTIRATSRKTCQSVVSNAAFDPCRGI